MLSVDQTLRVVQNASDYYKACLKNGFRMPEQKSKICSKQFMMDVRNKTVFCPQLSDIKLSACTDPPSIQIIQAELVSVIEGGIPTLQQPQKSQFINLAQYLRHSPGDTQWMLDLLSTLCDRQHEYFAKNYLPPKKVNVKFEFQVDNSDGFFTGLPESLAKPKQKHRVLNMMLTQQQRDQAEVQKLQVNANKIQTKLRQCQDRLNMNNVGVNLFQNANANNAGDRQNHNNQSFSQPQSAQVNQSEVIGVDQFNDTIEEFKTEVSLKDQSFVSDNLVQKLSLGELYAKSIQPNFITTEEEGMNY